MSNYLDTALRTKEAKQAYTYGIVELLRTGDLNKAWNAMVKQGKKNGSWQNAQSGLVMDFWEDFKRNFRL